MARRGRNSGAFLDRPATAKSGPGGRGGDGQGIGFRMHTSAPTLPNAVTSRAGHAAGDAGRRRLWRAGGASERLSLAPNPAILVFGITGGDRQ